MIFLVVLGGSFLLLIVAGALLDRPENKKAAKPGEDWRHILRGMKF